MHTNTVLVGALVLRWVFCADFGCVRRTTTALLRRFSVNCLHSQSCVESVHIVFLDKSIIFLDGVICEEFLGKLTQFGRILN